MRSEKFLLIDPRRTIINTIELLLLKLKCHHLFVVDETDSLLDLMKNQQFDLAIYAIDFADIRGTDRVLKVIDRMGLEVIYLIDNFEKSNPIINRLPNVNLLLTKPFKKLNLQSAIELFLKQRQEEENDDEVQKLVFKSKGQRIKLDLIKVNWVRANGNYCYISTDEEDFIIRSSLNNLKDQLPEEYFFQVHRSYIIQLAKINAVNLKAKEIEIFSEKIPIGKSYRKSFLAKLNII